MRFALILTALLTGCSKPVPPTAVADTVRFQFNPDGKIPCRSSLHDNTLDNNAFCLSSVSQEFAKRVTVETVTYEQAVTAIETNTALPWSKPQPVGTVTFAYMNHKRMSAMKVHDTWYYMWGESTWYVQVEPREDGRTCETVEVIEQGLVQFCSKNPELLEQEVHTLRSLIERVAGSKM